MTNLNAKINTLFPGDQNAGLREEIETSLRVPQWGPYHNEGAFMDSHLVLIFATLEAVAEGAFHSLISPAIQAILARAVIAHRQSLETYVLLHDLDKANCLTIKFADGSKRIVTWAEWQAMLAADSDGQLATQGDGEALFRFCRKMEIEQISYFQEPDRQHGKVAAERLRTMGVNEAVVRAIETHEAAYQFSRVAIDTYNKYFGDMSEIERDFALLASYVDTMASLRENGEPDMTNFMFLARSRIAAEAFVALETRLRAAPNLVAHLLQGELDKMRKSPTAFENETVEEAFARIVKAATPASYDTVKVTAALATFSELTADEVTAIIANPGDAGKLVGKKLGRRAGELKAALAACRL